MKTTKTYKLILHSLLALAPISSVFAYTATFDANDTEYQWNDVTIWDSVPDASGTVTINSGGFTGSSVVLKDKDLSANQYNTIINEGVTFVVDNSYYKMATNINGNIVINNATVNSINGSTFDVQGSNYANVVLTGSGVLNLDNTTFNQTSYGNIIGSGTSQFIFANGSTTNQSYGQFMFSGSAQVIIDNATYTKTIWETSVFSGNSKLVVKNDGYFNNGWSHKADVNIEFRDNAVLDLQSGGRFAISGGTNGLALYDDAKIELSGAGSTVTSINGIVLNDRAQINVREGATLGIAAITSLTVNSDDVSVNFYTDATWFGGAGNTISVDKGTINFHEGAVLTRNGDAAYIILAGNTKLNFLEGSIYNASANASFELTENASVTFDAAEYQTSSFGRMHIYDGEFNFTNGSTTTGTFLNILMKGNGKLNIDGAGTVFGQTQYNGEHWLIQENAEINVTNGATLRANGSHGDVVNLVLSDNAKLNVNGGTVTFNQWAGYTQRIQLSDNAKAVVKGTAAQKGKVTIGYIDIDNSTAGKLASFSLQGYGEVEVKNDITLGSGTAALGATPTQELTISGTGNTLTFVNLTMSGDSLFKISGSGNTITGTGALDAIGGTIMFVADASGVSTLNVASISTLDAEIIFDLSAYADDQTFTFLSSNTDWSAAAADFIASDKWNRTDAAGSTYDLSYDAATNSLVVSYTAVPEPSAYAALFGAIALAYAAYRRRK